MKGVYVASSVQDLANLAESSLPPIDNGMKLILYYRSAQQILLQANIYKNEGDFEKAYIHMMKYSILVISKLPKHSQYNEKDVTVQKAIQAAKQTARSLILEMEGMKLVLKKQYDEEQRAAELQKKKEQEELQALELEKEQRRIREEREKAEQEAFHLAQQQERMRQEQEQQQRLAMELFAKQQLLGIADPQPSSDGILQPLQSNSANSNITLQQSSDILAIQESMENLKVTEQHPILDQANQNESSEALPHDFFMSQTQSHKDTYVVSPSQNPQVDLLTPPIPAAIPVPPNEPATVTLLDLSQEIESSEPTHFSHLSALAPAKPQYPEVQDTAKTPVDYPNLYSKTPSNYTAKPTTQYQSPNVLQSNRNTTPNHQIRPSLPPPTYVAPQLPMNQPPMYMPPHSNFVTPMYGHPTAAHPTYLSPSIQPTRAVSTHSPAVSARSAPTQTHTNSPKFMPPTPSLPPSALPKVVSKPSVPRGPIEESPAEFGPSPAVRGNTLRKLVVYGEMFEAFMRVANSNTQRKIETCAILSGTLSKNVFHVTTMIVPKQEGTTDTCSTTNEEELFEYQMANNLLTLGWIHTHPTQDCFMSSVDLHTHCTYQLLLPEAIAVVISPMYTPNFGVFRVSDPPGMQIIQKCTQRGFHQHADTLGKTLYTLCDHVDLVWGTKNFKVVDLR